MRLKYSDAEGYLIVLNTVLKIGKQFLYIDPDIMGLDGKGIVVKRADGYFYITDKLYLNNNDKPVDIKLNEDYENLNHIYLINKETFEIIKTDLDFNLIKVMDKIDTEDFVARTYITEHEFVEEPWNTWREKITNNLLSVSSEEIK